MPFEIVNHCPFGCRDEDLDGSTGYCRHLVGFTNDGTTGELLQRIERTDKEGNKFYTFPQVTGRKIFKITRECKRVNPERLIQGGGNKLQQVAKSWLSDRVYHPQYNNQHFATPEDVQPIELPEIMDIPGVPKRQAV